MSLVIIGLFSTGDIGSLRRSLVQAGLAGDRLQAIDPNDARSGLTRGLAGSGLLEPDGGTSVPGISRGLRTAAFSQDDPIAGLLGDLNIPQSAIGNYQEALERGRFVIAYRANSGDVDRAEEAFRAAGIVNVRRY